MQDQTVPQNFLVTFDPLAGVDPLKVPAPATTSEIADCIQAAFEVIDICVGAIDVNLTAGTVAVEDTDGDVIERARIEGPGVGPEPEPDHWLTLADAIRQHADRVATLAGTDWKPVYAGLSFSMADPGNKNPIAGDMVDVVASAFGLTAQTVKSSGGYFERKASGGLDGLRFSVYGYVPEPEDAEKAALRAELEQLRAQLAEGGANREGRDPIDRRDLSNDQWRCPVCHHEAEHLLDVSGCVAKVSGAITTSTCGCMHNAGGTQ